jgi:hypothetical protein
MRDFIAHIRRVDNHRFWVYSEKRLQEILEEYPEDRHYHEIVCRFHSTDLIAERMGLTAKPQTIE